MEAKRPVVLSDILPSRPWPRRRRMRYPGDGITPRTRARFIVDAANAYVYGDHARVHVRHLQEVRQLLRAEECWAD